MPAHFGDKQFTEGTPYSLAVTAIVDDSRMDHSDPSLYTFSGVKMKAVLQYDGTAFQFDGTRSVELLYAPDQTGPTLISFAAAASAQNDTLWFTHNFSVPPADYPGNTPFDAIDLDMTQIASNREAVITLLENGNPTGRVYGRAQTLHHTVTPVPEPAPVALFASGLTVLAGMLRRRQRPT